MSLSIPLNLHLSAGFGLVGFSSLRINTSSKVCRQIDGKGIPVPISLQYSPLYVTLRSFTLCKGVDPSILTTVCYSRDELWFSERLARRLRAINPLRMRCSVFGSDTGHQGADPARL